MRSLIILSVFVVCSSAISVKYKDCGSTSKVASIDVTPCENQPCNLKHGSNYTVAITFTPDGAVKGVNVKIYGVVAGVPVPFPFDQPDGCKNSGLTCPLASGVQDKYTATLPILNSYPAIKLYVKWELVDADTSAALVCAEIPVAVVNGEQSEYKMKDVRRIHL